MPRPESPVDPNGGPVAEFAIELRALRQTSGLTYQTMSERVRYAVPTLSEAASGKKMPTWDVAWAYIRACGYFDSEKNDWDSPDQEQWRERWAKAGGLAVPWRHGSSLQVLSRPEAAVRHDAVSLAAIATRAEFAAALTAVKDHSMLSLRDIEKTARRTVGRSVPSSTTECWLNGRNLPSPEGLRTFLSVCGIREGLLDPWTQVLFRLKAATGENLTKPFVADQGREDNLKD